MPEDASLDLVQTLYLGAFGRPADPEGMVFWTRKLKSTWHQKDTLDLFLHSLEVQQQLNERGVQGFISHALDNLINPGHGWTPAPASDQRTPVKQILDYVKTASPHEQLSLNSRLRQAHRFTWGVAQNSIVYDLSVAERAEHCFQGDTEVEQLLASLPRANSDQTAHRDREFSRQLIASLPADISYQETRADRTLNAVLHLGSEKTGSSTIQNFMESNARGLRKHGVAYLPTKGRNDSRDLALYALDSFIADDRGHQLNVAEAEQRARWKDQFEQEFAARIQALPKNIGTVVFSSEHLQSRLKSDGNISLLRDLLAPYFKNITVVVYLRRQDQTAVSLYSTNCRNGWIDAGMFPENASAETPYYSHDKLLQRWAGTFGAENIRPRVFERGRLKDDNLIADFTHTTSLDLPIDTFSTPERKNESIPESAQIAIERLNGDHEIFRQLHANPHIKEVRLNIIAKVSQQFPGPPMMPARRDAEAFAKLFEQPNHNVSQHWFGGAPVFSSDFSMYPEERTIPDYELQEIDRIIANEVRKLPKGLENI